MTVVEVAVVSTGCAVRVAAVTMMGWIPVTFGGVVVDDVVAAGSALAAFADEDLADVDLVFSPEADLDLPGVDDVAATGTSPNGRVVPDGIAAGAGVPSGEPIGGGTAIATLSPRTTAKRDAATKRSRRTSVRFFMVELLSW
jgi:hypothetical protein